MQICSTDSASTISQRERGGVRMQLLSIFWSAGKTISLKVGQLLTILIPPLNPVNRFLIGMILDYDKFV